MSAIEGLLRRKITKYEPYQLLILGQKVVFVL